MLERQKWWWSKNDESLVRPQKSANLPNWTGGGTTNGGRVALEVKLFIGTLGGPHELPGAPKGPPRGPKSRYYVRRIWGCPERTLDALSVTGKDITFQNGLNVHIWNGMSSNRSKPCLFCRSGTALNHRSGTSLNCCSEMMFNCCSETMANWYFETMVNGYFETISIPDFKSLDILIPNQEWCIHSL